VCVRAVTCRLVLDFCLSWRWCLVLECCGCGRGGGFFMVGGSLRRSQRLRWGIWYASRLGDCLLCILRVCEIVRLCSCGLLSCDSAIPA
jgi:hypothetical protein